MDQQSHHHSRPVLRGMTIATLVAAMAGLAGVGAPAAAAPACSPPTQITDTVGGGTTSNFGETISGDGTRIAFVSSRDITGDNADLNREIFLYDSSGPTTTQVTSTTGSGTFAPAAISADGTHIAFPSEHDITGGNADGNLEIFLYDVGGASTSQLTATTGSGNFVPTISGDGTRIAFESSGNIGGGNGDGNSEIFLHDTIGPTTTQITATTGGDSGYPSISDDGTRIAFESTADIGGTNDDGNSEIFLHDTTGPTTTQITATTGGLRESTVPAISGNGDRVAFSSDRDLTGGNGDLNEEIFLYDTIGPATTQLTHTTGGIGELDPSRKWLAISEDGSRVAFKSDRNVGGGNADLNEEIFLHQTTDGTTTQVTSSTGRISLTPALSADGTRLALRSNIDLGDNADSNNEIFLSTCPTDPTFSDVPVDHPFFADIEWMAAEGISTGYADGTYKPGAVVTRQAMSAFMYRLAGEPPFAAPGAPSFDDVPLDHPFFAEIEWMADEAITTGYADGGFHPAAAVSRQAMSAFMHRLADGPGVGI